ncbi:MAG: hypothetical protein NVS3B28_08760 [Candidatus Velthaea sp.]
MQNIKLLTALSALGLGLAACSTNNDSVRLTPQPPAPGQATAQYVQIERLSRPAIKEVFEKFVDHQKSNAIEPYQDDLLKNSIVATEDFVRYGPGGPAAGTPDYGKDIAGVVYPDEYLVDLAQTTGSFLGTETVKNFGGRQPNEDVIGTELAVLFGTAISDGTLGVVLDKPDNKQNNCLKTQNLALNPTQASGPAFPYLPKPH